MLFVGLGYQVADFRKFIQVKKKMDRVYMVDIICYGTSPLIWKEHISFLEHKFNKNVTDVNFKYKRNGWKQPTAFLKFGTDEILLIEYSNLFYNQLDLRPSCYNCPYTSVKRNSDMTIGDYWGIDNMMPDFYDSMGNSLVLLHNSKGMELFNLAKDKLYFRLSNTEECLQPRLIYLHPAQANEQIFGKTTQNMEFTML